VADIFISYKKEDAGRVIRIVEALRAEGFSVWWDHGIAPGAQWDQTIQTELNAAKAVIAIWSEQSIAAPWVKEEAGVGKNRGILLPIRIDAVEPPLGFSLIQMGDLVGWSGDQNDPHWKLVLEALRAIIRGDLPKGLEAAPRRKPKMSPWALGAAALALVLAAVFGAILFTARSPQIASPGAPIDQAAPHAPAQSTTLTAASPQEQALWDEAMAAKTREKFQAFLVTFPNGFYAARARETLLTCRSELRETWASQTTGQMLRGVNMEPAASEQAGCAAAHLMAEQTGERTCRAFVANNPANARNAQLRMQDGPCNCTQTPGGYSCIADPSFTCTWEMRSQAPIDICGG